MQDVAAAMTDPDKAAEVYLTLADLAAAGTPGLRDRTDLAREALTRAPALDVASYLVHGIPANDVLTGLGTADLEADLQAATEAVIAGRTADHGAVEWWIALLTLAHAIDRTIPIKLGSQVEGVGFYRAWMRYTIATIGIAEDVATGITHPKPDRLSSSWQSQVWLRRRIRSRANRERATCTSSTRSSTRLLKTPSSSSSPTTSLLFLNT